MQETLEKEAFRTGWCWRLPCRQLGPVRNVGWGVVGFGVLGGLFMLGWLALPVNVLLDGMRAGKWEIEQWFMLLFLAAGGGGLLVCIGFALVGFAIAANRTMSEIRFYDSQLLVLERFGVLSKSRRCAVTEIARLRIVDADHPWESDEFSLQDSGRLGEWMGVGNAILLAERQGKPPFFVAVAYPQELLVKIAAELAQQVETACVSETAMTNSAIAPLSSLQDRKIAVVGTDASAPPEELTPVQPSDSRTELEIRENGVTIKVPPLGLLRGSGALVLFVTCWNLVTTLGLISVTLGWLGYIQFEGSLTIACSVLIPFLAIGIALTIAVIHWGTSTTTIATAGDSLIVIHQSIFGKNIREWSSHELLSIVCGPSGIEVNNNPVYELQFQPVDGKRFGCLRHLNPYELKWIAYEVNRSLGRPASRNVASPSRFPRHRLVRDNSSVKPLLAKGSRLAFHDIDGGIKLVIPALGLRKQIALLAPAMLFMGIGVGVPVALSTVGNIAQRGAGFDWGFLFGMPLAFIGVGLALLYVTILLAYRRFVVEVDKGEVGVRREDPFGCRQWTWKRGELESVDVVDSNISQNGRKLFRLQLRGTNGTSTLHIMTGYEEHELALVADYLHQVVFAEASTI